MSTQTITERLSLGSIVVTPNNRLAQEVIHNYYLAFPENVVEKPQCMPYEQFISSLFNEFCNVNPEISPPVLLTQQQVEFLWVTIVGDLSTPGVMAEIIEAWRRCLLWQIELDCAPFELTPQALQFQAWVRLLTDKLRELKAITVPEIVPYLVQNSFTAPKSSIVWYCFDDFSPQQQTLQAYFSAQGTLSVIADVNPENQTTYLCHASDDRDETQQLITWIKTQLDNNAQKIGIVMANIAEGGESLLRTLKEAFPLNFFNISLGKPLNTYPLVSHALSWLFLDRETISNEQARLLLYTPFLAGSRSEFFERSQALEECKSLEEVMVNFNLFLEEITTKAPILATTLKAIRRFPHKASISEWLQLFTERLNQLGFPGDSPLDSYNYQCYQRFLTLFDLFQSIHLLTPILSKSEALSAFSALTNATFQPETVNAQIEILGVLEASGRTFDSLWMLGLTQDSYPQKIQPSAFIPIDIQRDFNMPRATTERELALAIKQIHRFIDSSQHCVFSYPRFSGDKPNLPCALLTTLPNLEQICAPPSMALNYLEPFELDFSLAVNAEESIKGGTRLLANQAKCPFRAFAEHRLHARQSNHYTDGLTHLERGRALHHVLELIWTMLSNQQNLLSQSQETISLLINKSIETAIKPLQKWRPYSFSPLIAKVEYDSLARRAEVCLDWDKERPSFEVEKIESDFSYMIGPLLIKLRIDRLDKLSNGKKWVIDYKSSMPQALPWNEERPQEPQLLVYSLLDDDINGLLFLSMKEGKLACRGLSDNALTVSGIASLKEPEQWHEKRASWQQQLETLAYEFYQGHCAPQPINSSTCKPCEYKRLCRYKS